MRRDRSDIERLFADEFCGVNSAGVEMSKADLIREMSSTDYVINVVWVKGRNSIRIGFSVEAIRDNLDVGTTRSATGSSTRSRTF